MNNSHNFLDHPRFLPPFSITPHSTVEFCGIDTKELFDENLSKKDRSWYYRTNKIKYKFNIDGYRTNDWEDTDWKNSVVLLGCSQTLGIGLCEHDTVSANITRILKRPVVNLGAGGTSMFFSFYNSLILKKHFPLPWAVVHLWSGISRFSYFDVDNYIAPLGPWKGNMLPVYKFWAKSHLNVINQNSYMPFVSPIIWSDTRYYQATVFEDTATNTGIDFITYDDYARDCSHVGKDSAHKIAIQICNNLT